MARCRPELIDDLDDVFAELRTWDGIVEKGPGTFYFGREPFLHFHASGASPRRADVRRGKGWLELDLPRPSTAARRRALLRELRVTYREKTRA